MPYSIFSTKSILILVFLAEVLPFAALGASLEPLGKKSIISDSGSDEADDIALAVKKLEAGLRSPNNSNFKAGDIHRVSEYLQDGPEVLYSRYTETEDAIGEKSLSSFEEEYDGDDRNDETFDDDDEEQPCTDCAAKKRKLALLSEDELNRLRIKHIKQQILDKLRMSQPPNITRGKFTLPKALTDDNHGYYKDEYDMNIEEYYGKTSQVIILAEEDKERCHSKSPPEGCFQFRLTSQVFSKSNTIQSAELWLYKMTESNTTPDPIITIEELPLGQSRGVTKKLNVKEISIKDGWITFDIKHVLRRWQNHGRVEHSLIARCENCPGLTSDESPVVTDGEKRPFILINPSDTRSRSKRSANCVQGMTKCCMGRFYVNFEDINWHDWIIQPRGFYANYCNGSCDGTTFPRYHHTLFMVRAKNARENADIRDELSPCCSPTKMSSLSLIYYNNDGYIITKTLPNMKVEACGCA